MDLHIGHSPILQDGLAIRNTLGAEEDSLSQAAASIERALACAHERGEERAVRVLHAVMALLATKPGH